MKKAIETFDLTKRYNGKGGCENICLSVNEGQVFSLLGPNGAGKSTCIKTLLGLLKADSGEAFLLGEPISNINMRKRIGFLPELFKYQDWMTGSDLLKYHAKLAYVAKEDIPKMTASAAEIAGISAALGKRIGSYSKGMQQRIGIATALVANPDLVFLDEPTSALDPIGRLQVREMIKHLKNEGKTVFLNSHLLSEVEMVSDQVAFIRQGRTIAAGDMRELLGEDVKLAVRAQGIDDVTFGMIQDKWANAQLLDWGIEIPLSSDNDVPQIVSALCAHGARIYEVNIGKLTLEELFVRLMDEDGKREVELQC